MLEQVLHISSFIHSIKNHGMTSLFWMLGIVVAVKTVSFLKEFPV